MPTISRFFGIVISMYVDEHGRPHFHATYAEHHASIDIESNEILEGRLPARQTRLVRRWASLHRDALLTNWRLARAGKPLIEIAPLS